MVFTGYFSPALQAHGTAVSFQYIYGSFCILSLQSLVNTFTKFPRSPIYCRIVVMIREDSGGESLIYQKGYDLM